MIKVPHLDVEKEKKKYKIVNYCKKCNRPNYVIVFEGLDKKDLAKINPCQCKLYGG